MTTPATAGRRVRPRARRAALPETDTGLISRDRFAAQHGVNARTVDAWVREGMPYVKIRNLTFFRVEAVRAWLASLERRDR